MVEQEQDAQVAAASTMPDVTGDWAFKRNESDFRRILVSKRSGNSSNRLCSFPVSEESFIDW